MLTNCNVSDENVIFLKEIISFCESKINNSENEVGKDCFLNKLKILGALDEDFEETDEDRLLKSQYIKASVLYDELSFYDVFFRDEGSNIPFFTMYYMTKNSFLTLSLLKSNINNWGQYYKNDNVLITLQRQIFPGLEFTNHLRNKISGHIETDVMNNTVQWGPYIFEDICKKNKLLQKRLIYQYILESAINSYLDKDTHQHKIFGKEIYLSDSSTCKTFYEYLQNLIVDSIKYLSLVKEIINSKIFYFHGTPANLIKKASETDFVTKNKGR